MNKIIKKLLRQNEKDNIGYHIQEMDLKGHIGYYTEIKEYKLNSIIDGTRCYIPLKECAEFKNSIFLLFMTEFLEMIERSRRGSGFGTLAAFASTVRVLPNTI